MTNIPPQYDEQYFRTLHNNQHLKRFSSSWWAVRWYAKMAAAILQKTKGNRVLEVGCGLGFTLAFLEQQYETYGIDISDYAVSQASAFSPRSTFMVADIEQGIPPGLSAGSFDLIIAKYVLEHLKDPGQGLIKITSLLRPGGVLFFSVPHTDSIGARLKGKEWHALKDPTHCSLLTRKDWLALLEKSGLELIRESSDGLWDIPYVNWLPRFVQFPIFLGPTIAACLSGRPILPAGLGENILIFGRKPILSQ